MHAVLDWLGPPCFAITRWLICDVGTVVVGVAAWELIRQWLDYKAQDMDDEESGDGL